MYRKILILILNTVSLFKTVVFLFPCSFHHEIQENYSEDKIYAVLMTVFLSQAVSPLSQFDCCSCIQSSTQHWQQ